MDKYRVNEDFELISFSRALAEHFDLRYLYEAQIRQKGRYLCSIGIRKGTHQGVIRLMMVGGSLRVLVTETIDSASKNIWIVAVAVVAGLVIGKEKGVGKSMFGAAGYKTFDNLRFKRKTESIVSQFILQYLNR